MTDAEKETLIRKLYFNESGFGSPFQIYKEAKLKIPTITLDFIRNYLKTIIERSEPTGGGKNSFVAPRAFHEYQVNVFFYCRQTVSKTKI